MIHEIDLGNRGHITQKLAAGSVDDLDKSTVSDGAGCRWSRRLARFWVGCRLTRFWIGRRLTGFRIGCRLTGISI